MERTGKYHQEVMQFSKGTGVGIRSHVSLRRVHYELHARPAPGTPFHLAFPVHCLKKARAFYGGVLGCAEGRSSEKWIDFSLHGHQIVAHWVGADYRGQDFYNPVDGDEVPVPHYGLVLSYPQWRALADRFVEFQKLPAGPAPATTATKSPQLAATRVELGDFRLKFMIEPTLRFEGMPGEQHTMFLKDPSGNNWEFKAMAKHELLFAKYNVE
eukprot:g77702.t1